MERMASGCFAQRLSASLTSGCTQTIPLTPVMGKGTCPGGSLSSPHGRSLRVSPCGDNGFRPGWRTRALHHWEIAEEHGSPKGNSPFARPAQLPRFLIAYHCQGAPLGACCSFCLQLLGTSDKVYARSLNCSSR